MAQSGKEDVFEEVGWGAGEYDPMKRDAITANLPSRDFKATSVFYQALGFREEYRDTQWMILSRGDLILEFFPCADLNPSQSTFSVCVRVRKVDALYDQWCKAALPFEGIPRMSDVVDHFLGMLSFSLVDLDGSLLRVMEPIK
jgi:hypothetical protein